MVGPQSFQRAVDGAPQMVRLAVQRRRLAFLHPETELGGDGDLIADRSKRFADKLFAEMRAIDFGGVEKCHTQFERGANERHTGFAVARSVTIVSYQRETSEADGGDLQIAEFAATHRLLPAWNRSITILQMDVWTLSESTSDVHE